MEFVNYTKKIKSHPTRARKFIQTTQTITWIYNWEVNLYRIRGMAI